MWIEKVTGDLADKRRYRRYRERVRGLPAGYRDTGLALERYLLNLGPGDGKTLVDMLEDLLEQSAAARTPIRDVVGEDPAVFAEAFLANYSKGSWIGKERERVARSIDRAVGEEAAR